MSRRMSRGIEEIVRVLELIKFRYMASDRRTLVSTLRLWATKIVAQQDAIDERTVRDKYTRQLGLSTHDFDTLVDRWLAEGSLELKTAVSRGIVDHGDQKFVGDLFGPIDPLIPKGFDVRSDEVRPAEFLEGVSKLRVHITRERNTQLVKEAKTIWNQRTKGKPVCSVCGFCFATVYGDIGTEFIEAHHTTPVSDLTSETVMAVQDLVPVCSNCHAMLHRRQPWLTVDELKTIVMGKDS